MGPRCSGPVSRWATGAQSFGDLGPPAGALLGVSLRGRARWRRRSGGCERPAGSGPPSDRFCSSGGTGAEGNGPRPRSPSAPALTGRDALLAPARPRRLGAEHAGWFCSEQ